MRIHVADRLGLGNIVTACLISLHLTHQPYGHMCVSRTSVQEHVCMCAW